jgi:predicted ATPase
VLSRYHEEARAVLERHGGYVEKFIGDAVMAVFGIPVLHEDDALRAARAAVELRDAIGDLSKELERSSGVRIALRTGVNTGEVIAGDWRSGHSFVTGDAVNVAQRLEASATPGEILIGKETYSLARDAVVAEPIEPLEVKGKRRRVPAYRLLDVMPGKPAHARRFDSPMVGRDRELTLLEDAFARSVRQNSCHLFTVLGSAGVGKSRLVREVLKKIGDDATVLTAACLPYGEGITFWPVREIVKQATGIEEDDPPDRAQAKIASALEGDESAQLAAQRIAEVIGLAGAAGTAEEGFWGVRKLLEGLARGHSAVVVFDDLHWAEPTLLDLIEHVAEWSYDAPILLVCMSRPELLELRPDWGGGKRNATTILLESLSEDEIERLIRNLLGRAVPDSFVHIRIQEAAAGNPLFVEEMFSMLIDEGLLRPTNGHWIVAGDLSRVRVPSSIGVLLASRLDQLSGVERRALQCASIEGNVFHRGAVEALAREDERAGVSACLARLVHKELSRPNRPSFADEEGFRFRHPLMRDAAYGALPKTVRGELHERYAAWLGQRAGEYDAVVGYHLEQAFRCRAELGPISEDDRLLGARASELLASAGRRALARGDVHAAIDLLERAIALRSENDEGRLELLPKLGAALRESGALARAEQVLEEAIAEARRVRSRGVELSALIERAALLSLKDPAATDQLLAEIEAAVPELERLGDDHALAAAWTLIGARFGLWKGRFARGEEALERALEHARRAGDRRQEALILGQLCFAAATGPTPVPQAIRRCHEILDQAQGQRLVEAGVGRFLGMLEARRGRFSEARDLAARARQTYEELGMHVLTRATATIAWGDIELLAGEYDAAERELRASAEALERMGERGYWSTVAAYLARALYGQERLDEAEEVARRSQESASEEDIWSQVLSRGTLAKVLVRRGDVREAEQCAHEAVRFVAETDALDLHGRAVLDLAEVLFLAGRHEAAGSWADQALQLFQRKGNDVLAEHARRLLEHAAQPPLTASEDRGDPAS